MKYRNDTIIAFGLIVFCLINYFYLIPSQVIKQGSQSTYVYIVNTFLFLSSIGYFFQGILQKKFLTSGNQENKINKDSKKSIIIIILVAIWILLMDYLGFLLSTIVFLIVSIATLSNPPRNYPKLLILSILFSLFIYILFTVILKTILPEGILEVLLQDIIY
ncbi:MAG: tripartite tricarboxylate transporter TctB family protein [Candidatus Atribacteria bacterium]|nr:tripartite tricarboxylate transporter TctB family protein [Candidatus Atribacteria bacterium]